MQFAQAVQRYDKNHDVGDNIHNGSSDENILLIDTVTGDHWVPSFFSRVASKDEGECDRNIEQQIYPNKALNGIEGSSSAGNDKYLHVLQ